MNIGIDFDNTIAHYDSLFKKVAISEGLINEIQSIKNKADVRNYLIKQKDGHTSWMKLQGLVYGRHMHFARLMPGVANFFLSCKMLNHRIFIVSHKTEFGHLDKQRISLRKEALKWMEMKRFFDPELFGLKKEDVFFANTREEKVDKIEELNCEFFIDDLPEVFEETHFPLNTKKILFGRYNNSKHPEDIFGSKSWRTISEMILGQITDERIIFWSSKLLGKSITRIENITGRGNSNVFKITTNDGNRYALKHYPEPLENKKPRLSTEFNSLLLLKKNSITNVPEPINKDIDLELGLFEWIEGENVVNPTYDDLSQAIKFVRRLFFLSRKTNGHEISLASEACLSIKDIINQIENRLLILKSVSEEFPDLLTFLESIFCPLWNEVKNNTYSRWPNSLIDRELSIDKQILSPSDFGFHNTIRDKTGKLIFIDFDYFGWDDPVKLTADFLWHPAMKLTIEMKEKWTKAMSDLMSGDSSFNTRLEVGFPLFGLRWVLIILNEFLPGISEKRKNAKETKKYDILVNRKTQLKKAKQYCEKVKDIISKEILCE